MGELFTFTYTFFLVEAVFTQPQKFGWNEVLKSLWIGLDSVFGYFGYSNASLLWCKFVKIFFVENLKKFITLLHQAYPLAIKRMKSQQSALIEGVFLQKMAFSGWISLRHNLLCNKIYHNFLPKMHLVNLHKINNY